MPPPAAQRFVALAVCALAGCGPSRPTPMVPPALDPEAVTAAVLERADANRDGIVGRTELAAIPALAGAVTALDDDGDGGVSAAELRQWLDLVQQSRIAITSFDGQVRHRGQPLAGVTVTLVPEACMGDGMRPAAGVTDALGRFSATIADSPYPGVNCGLYRVEITGPDGAGRPLPAAYNSQTTLGAAVGGRLPDNGVANFVLE